MAPLREVHYPSPPPYRCPTSQPAEESFASKDLTQIIVNYTLELSDSLL